MTARWRIGLAGSSERKPTGLCGDPPPLDSTGLTRACGASGRSEHIRARVTAQAGDGPRLALFRDGAKAGEEDTGRTAAKHRRRPLPRSKPRETAGELVRDVTTVCAHGRRGSIRCGSSSSRRILMQNRPHQTPHWSVDCGHVLGRNAPAVRHGIAEGRSRHGNINPKEGHGNLHPRRAGEETCCPRADAKGGDEGKEENDDDDTAFWQPVTKKHRCRRQILSRTQPKGAPEDRGHGQDAGAPARHFAKQR